MCGSAAMCVRARAGAFGVLSVFGSTDAQRRITFSQPAKDPEVTLSSFLPELSEAQAPCIDSCLVAEFTAAGPLLVHALYCAVTQSERALSSHARASVRKSRRDAYPAWRPVWRHTLGGCGAGISGASEAQHRTADIEPRVVLETCAI